MRSDNCNQLFKNRLILSYLFQFLQDIQVEDMNNDICTANINGKQNPLRTKSQVVEANNIL